VGIASAEGAGAGDEGQSDKQHIEQIRAGCSTQAGYTQVDQTTTPGRTDTMVSSALNAGRGVLNLLRHGSATSWAPRLQQHGRATSLQNDNLLRSSWRWPATTGSSTTTTSVSRRPGCARSANGEPIGAIGMYASSCRSRGAADGGQDEFNLKLTDPTAPFRGYGACASRGRCAMMDKYGSGGVEMFDTWNIFGTRRCACSTPGLEITPLMACRASGDAGGPFVPASKVYTPEEQQVPAAPVRVSSPAPWLAISGGSGTIRSAGKTTITVTLNDHARAISTTGTTPTSCSSRT